MRYRLSKRSVRRPGNRRLIITADDFGLDASVNEAVERAHVDGVLSAASLMVGAPAAADAARRALAWPDLGVGLHLVLTDGVATLPAEKIPALVGRDGRFDDNMARAGARFFFRPRTRRQLAAEIRAQFEAFAATGLPLDHVNAHKHFHLHPTITRLVLDIGADFGLRAMRVPREPPPPTAIRFRLPNPIRAAETRLVDAWSARLKQVLARRGIRCNDYVFGLRQSGHMNEQALLDALRALPSGVTEIYLHPATRGDLTTRMAGYDHTGELAALVSPSVRAFLDAHAIRPARFAELD